VDVTDAEGFPLPGDVGCLPERARQDAPHLGLARARPAEPAPPLVRRGRAALRERRAASDYPDVVSPPPSALLVVLGADGTVELANRRACEVLGLAEDELVGADWFATAVPAGERGDARHSFTRLLEHPGEHEERFASTAVTRDGAERLVVWHSALRTDATGAVTGVVRSGEDVTGEDEPEAEDRRPAHDPLTGLPGSALLDEHLALAVARARRHGTEIALLRFDLEGFGLVNDALGRAAGDEVLKQTAQRVRDVTRANDLLARPGGDEFVLLLSDLDSSAAESATVVGRLIRDSLSTAFALEGAEFHLGASIGVSLYPAHADNADDLLRRADVALQQARRRGTGPAFFEPAEGARTRLSPGARLRRALDRDELVLHLQPVVSPSDGRLHGAEALLRWDDPEQGLLLPAAFLPAAKDAGLTDELGAWVLDAVCRQARAWQRDGAPPVRLSYNLASSELRRPGLAATILDRLAAHGLDPATVCLEIAEDEATPALVRELHAAGLAVVLDRFGSGPTSLATLRELPLAAVKLDRALLAPVPHDPQAAAVLAAVLTLTRALGTPAVAVGVETAEQHRFLLEHGCPLAQGFHLGRPAPAGELRRGAPRPR
jgi:diguanylate cyclase (GGDEF)-like protein/PAS domain S-box-containing protein